MDWLRGSLINIAGILLCVLVFVALMIILYVLDKRKYLRKINQKLNSMNCRVQSIKTIPEPEFINGESTWQAGWVWHGGASALKTTFKQIDFEDGKRNKYQGIIGLNRFCFITLSINYYLPDIK